VSVTVRGGSTTDQASDAKRLIKEGNQASKYTDRGTKIVKPGEDMDKNAFLKILVAEMSHQDPTQPQDSTAQVTQLAQFASMEQTNNLNTNMSQYAANALLGKTVLLNASDTSGKQYSGTVCDVTKAGSNITVGVQVKEGSSYKILDVNLDDIETTVDTPNTNMNSISSATNILTAASLIGKSLEYTETQKDADGKDTDVTLKGKVKSVIKDGTTLKLQVENSETQEVKSISIDKITKIE
jgi:flagellar basal-body rod modification protein FlgD